MGHPGTLLFFLAPVTEQQPRDAMVPSAPRSPAPSLSSERQEPAPGQQGCVTGNTLAKSRKQLRLQMVRVMSHST